MLKKLISIFFCFLFFIIAKAEDSSDLMAKRKEEYKIDSHNLGGKNLIYDCEKKNFACVNEESFENCRIRRKMAITSELKNLNCAPLKSFETKKDCLINQYKKQDDLYSIKFCFNNR
jgi:hypothetical protein